MAIVTLQDFGKPFFAFDDTKLSVVSSFDLQERLDHPVPAKDFRYNIRIVCGGGVLDIGFRENDQLNWQNCYSFLMQALNRNAV